MRRLIINADDFGFTRDVNAGIVHAHRSGVLTSTTLMANGDAFDDAVELARNTPTLDVGCHLVLVQGRSLLTGNPFPETVAQLLAVLGRRGLNVHEELRAQIEKILANGVTVTHLDSHKHTHLLPNIFRAVVRLAEEFSIPYVRLPLDGSMRWARACYTSYIQKISVTDHFRGFRLTGKLTEETFGRALERLPEGITEFMCHPGYLKEDLRLAKTRLKESRARELLALTSPQIREIIEKRGIELIGFR